MHQPIDQGGRECVVHVENRTPVLEGAVRRDNDRTGFVSGSDDLEQEIGTALVYGQIYQLIQEKLARMEVARMNLQNLVFRTIELASQGKGMSLAEASAMKLYAARAAVEVAMEAVQVYGGNGYMAEYHVEQLARDAKVLQIYAGTDEIQIRAIARELLQG